MNLFFLMFHGVWFKAPSQSRVVFLSGLEKVNRPDSIQKSAVLNSPAHSFCSPAQDSDLHCENKGTLHQI